MSCNKPNCCKNKNLPREEMLSGISIGTAITLLLDLAKTGKRLVNLWPSLELAQLAEKIALLYTENERLKRQLNVDNPTIDVRAATVSISFGPDNLYTLQIPVADQKHRLELSRVFALTAARLMEPQDDANTLSSQLTLPFGS